MAEFPTYEQMANNVAEKALDEFLYDGKSIREWIKIIAEQEPCEDCISREAVNTLVDELARAISDERCCMSRGRSTETIMQDILELPPVTPQPKIGRWIEDTNGTYTDNHDTWECSKCGHAQILLEGTPIDNNYNYCPNCGAKMQEVEE